MSTTRFDNFGLLYRAALAETDPEVKQVLLADVKRVLDRWAETNDQEMSASKIPQGSIHRQTAILDRAS